MNDEQFDFEQWKRDKKASIRAEREALGPGVHKVGANPWDYVYNPAVGQTMTFVNVDGTSLTGTITDFTENDETGVIQLFTDEPEG